MLKVLTKFPVPCAGTIVVWSQKFEKVKKVDFFQMIFQIFVSDC